MPAAVTYDGTANRATVTPNSPLAVSSVYTATIKSGAGGVKDAAGNPLAADYGWGFASSASNPFGNGPGGPILVVTSAANPFSRYYAEILRAEGLNAFGIQDLSSVTATTLNQYDVVILGEMALTAAQVTMFTNWVTNGGNLISMRPDKKLAGQPVGRYLYSNNPVGFGHQRGGTGGQVSERCRGYITGLRFYKAATNTGTHVGNLWTAAGSLLSSVTFTNETASGWQIWPCRAGGDHGRHHLDGLLSRPCGAILGRSAYFSSVFRQSTPDGRFPTLRAAATGCTVTGPPPSRTRPRMPPTTGSTWCFRRAWDHPTRPCPR